MVLACPVFAEIPDWVKETGMYVKDDWLSIEGYLLTYDLSSKVKFEQDIDGKISKGEEDVFGCTSVVFARNNLVYVRGLVYSFINREGYSGWIVGTLSDDGRYISLEPDSRICYSLSTGHTFSMYYWVDVKHMKINAADNIISIKEDPIKLRITEDHDLEYVRPESLSADEAGGFGYVYYYSSSFYDLGQHNYENTKKFYVNPKITLQNPQMFPKQELNWDNAMIVSEEKGTEASAVRYAFDDNIFYLNISGNLLIGRVEGNKVYFRGNQITSPGVKASPIKEQYGLSDDVYYISIENAQGKRQQPFEKEFSFSFEETVLNAAAPSVEAEETGNGKVYILKYDDNNNYNYMCLRDASSGDEELLKYLKPSISYIKNKPSAVTDINDETGLRISANILRLDKPARIQIYSMSGSAIVDTSASEYDLSSLTPGIYIVRAAGKTLKVAL